MTTEIFEMDFENGGLKPVQDAVLSIGQIIFLNGYGQDEHSHERKAIYEVTNSSYDGRLQYKWVNLDKPEKGIQNAYEIKPISEKFGIGTYYKVGDLASSEEIVQAILAALKETGKKEALAKINEIETNLVKQWGEELFHANWPKKEPLGLIVAEYMVNDSDAMTDYFNAQSKRTVILAFTFTKRDNFNELRKACLNCDIPEIRQFAVKPTVDQNGKEKSEENKAWWKPADEQRENYAGGSGNYLGYSRYSGWNIRKDCYRKIEEYYYAAGKDNGFYAFKAQW